MARRPVASQKLPCIGGPMDGRVVSALDLPRGAALRTGAPTQWRFDEYVRASRNGREAWIWTEVAVDLNA